MRCDANGVRTEFTCSEIGGTEEPARCFATLLNDGVELSWRNEGDGVVVFRKDGRWLSTPAAGVVVFNDPSGVDDTGYVLRLYDNERTRFNDYPCR